MVTNSLRRHGHTVTGTPMHVLKTVNGLKEMGVNVSILRVVKRGQQEDIENSYTCNLLNAVWRIPQVIREFKPTVLHCHSHKPALLALPFANPFHLPIILELHGWYVPSQGGTLGKLAWLCPVLKASEGWVIKRADHVITQANAMRLEITDVLGVPPNKVSTLYPGCIVEEFSAYNGPSAAIVGLDKGERVIMYVGTTHSYQGLGLLAEAQHHIDVSVKVRTVLVVSNQDAASVMEEYNFEKSSTTVVTLEHNSLLPALMASADVLVHTRPDCNDNLNVQSKLGLYLASGKPIVATNVGDYPMLLGGHKGSILTAPEPEGIAAGISEAINNPEIAQFARMHGPKLARHYFERDKNIRKLVGIYNSIAGGRSVNS